MTGAARDTAFADELSNWRRNRRRRFWKAESDADKGRLPDAYTCSIVTRLAALFNFFIAEALYRNLVVAEGLSADSGIAGDDSSALTQNSKLKTQTPESVHLYGQLRQAAAIRN